MPQHPFLKSQHVIIFYLANWVTVWVFILCHIHRADYNPDQYLWEKEFSLAGRTYQRQDLEASIQYLFDGLLQLLLPIYRSYIMIPIVYVCTARLSILLLCSSRMPEAIPWSVVIISPFLFLKILLFLVLYIAMETGLCYFYGHCYWFWIMIINIIFWTFTSSRWHSLPFPFWYMYLCSMMQWM